MLQSLSWGDYFTFISFLTIAYYGGILLLYYRNELSNLFKNGFNRYRWARLNNKKTGGGVTSEMSGLSGTLVHTPKNEDTPVEPAGGFENGQLFLQPDPFHERYTDPNELTLFPYVHELMDEIGQVFKTAAHKNYIKEELIAALQIKVSKYPMLEGTVFKSTVSSFIVAESRKACSVFLSEDELERFVEKKEDKSTGPVPPDYMLRGRENRASTGESSSLSGNVSV